MTKFNDSIESVGGTWEFNRDAVTGAGVLNYYKPDGDSPSVSVPVTLDELNDLRTLFPELDKHLQPLEIEKKFVLLRLPHAMSDDVIVMNQYYGQEGKDKDSRFRIRQSMGLISGMVHHRTEKDKISDGVFIEKEEEISATEFQRLRAMCYKVIRKTRFVYGLPGTDLKWEVDHYHDLDIITAEIELPTLDHPFTIEPYMEEVMDEEVTGQNKYFNSKMAVDYAHVQTEEVPEEIWTSQEKK